MNEEKQKKLRDKNASKEMKALEIKEKKLFDDLAWIAKSSEMKKQSEITKQKRQLQSKADKLEKERVLDSKKSEKERERQEKLEMSKNLSNVENYYNNQIRLINDQLKNEKFETQVMLEA